MVVLIAVPLTIFLSQQKQENRSHASQEDPVEFTVGGHQYHLSDVKQVALEQYDAGEINQNAIDTAKKILMERVLLDGAADELSLSVDQSDIDQVASDEGISGTEAKYEVLRNEVIAAKVRYVKALSIGFWEPTSDQQGDYTADEWSGVQHQITDGGHALDSVENDIADNGDVGGMAAHLISTYPSLSEVLAMNGYIYSLVDDADKSDLAQPAIYEYGDSNFDAETRDAVFASSNEVGKIVRVGATSSSGGGTVFKITEIRQGTEDSYDSWLLKKRRTKSDEKTNNLILGYFIATHLTRSFCAKSFCNAFSGTQKLSSDKSKI